MSKHRGAVACGHPATAAAAIEVLGEGGNAADAAIAAFFSACVHEPVLASIGGGGFAMCRTPGAAPRVLDFFTQTPSTRRPASELDFQAITVDFGAATQEFHVGLGSIAVPGAVAGMFELQRRAGRMGMRELVQPALDAIRRAPRLSALQAHILSVVEPIYMGRESARRLFESPSVPGRVLQEGDPIRATAFADFLEILAIEGPGLFYRGELAALLDADCRARGGSVSRRDMQAYEVEWRRPLSVDFRDSRVWLNPPPSAGGVLILFALEVLNRTGVPVDRADFYQRLAEVMRITNEARARTTSADCAWPELELLLGEGFVAAYADDLARRARAWRGTTHISVVDAAGGMVGMTVSNGEGCGEVAADTGVMFNNMLGEEDLNPAGFHRWKPDQRMSSMMAPTLLERPGEVAVMLGSGGSNRIRTAVLQVLVGMVDMGLDIQAATLAPRIHRENEVLNLEGGLPEGIDRRLTASCPEVVRFDGSNFFFGGVHSVVRDGHRLSGAGDPRRAGVFVTC